MAKLTGRIARSDGSFRSGRLDFDAKISSLDSATEASSDFILPGFIDLQVNGSHGIDVMDASADALLQISHKLAGEGATGWLPTAVTSPIEHIERVHRTVSEAIKHQRQEPAHFGAAILGMHLEGPFISPLRLGAHPALNIEPIGEALERILALQHLKLLTIAPELPGSIEAIRRLTARAVAVSIGHTNATLEQGKAGIGAGARMFTHLFNAMRPLSHRDPGVITAALTSTSAICAVIPDGIHVHSEILRMVCAIRGAGRMILTTDKVSLSGTGAGSASGFALQQARIDGGAARLSDGTLAGSIISMLDGVRLMVEKAGASIGETAMMAAANPAAILGIADRGCLMPGMQADIIVLSPDLKLKAVYIAGREVS